MNNIFVQLSSRYRSHFSYASNLNLKTSADVIFIIKITGGWLCQCHLW